MLCSVVCVVACCCCCGCGLLWVFGVSACAVSIALVPSYLLVACGIRWFFFLSLLSHAPVCRFNMPPCVRSKRPRVCQHHAHMCFNMCACRYTRGHFERTHGGVLNGLTAFFQRVSPHNTAHTHAPQDNTTTHHNSTAQHITRDKTQDTRDNRQQDTERETERDRE